MFNVNKRKISIILPDVSIGGVKYLALLLTAIIKLKPNYEITIFEDIKEVYSKKLIIDTLSSLGVIISDNFFSSKFKTHIKFLDRFINKCRQKAYQKKQLKQLKLDKADLLFCPWPYEYNCPDVDMPIVCVPHDFNYTHHFGMSIYEYKNALRIRKQHDIWFKKATPIVSSYFIAKELKRAFPQFDKKVNVIHLSKLNNFNRLDEDKVDNILKELNINFNFVLSANNTTYHKNYNLLYAGYYYLKQKYPNIKLIMTGVGTHDVDGICNSPNYIDLFQNKYDVKGLGLVKDEVLIALMQRAKMVINPSLYEAGNGSGLDAWGLGTPVVMSNIEPFVEQMNVLGVKAQTFDPKDAKDMADAMIRILENSEQTQKDVQDSLIAINNYTWENIAQKYVDVFEKAILEYKNKQVIGC